MKTYVFGALKRLAAVLMKTPVAHSRTGAWAYKRLYRAFGPKEITLLECQGSKIFVDPRDEGIAMFLLTNGVFDPHETELVRSLLAPGMVVVDIGANIGYYSLLAARCVGPEGHVYAFEPVPANVELLRRSVEANGYTQVQAIAKAVSDREGTIRLFVDARNFGNASIDEANVPDGVGAVEAPAVTLDGFFASRPDERPQFIKIDAQGAEGRILAGADRVLGGGSMKILLEFWPFGLKNAGADPPALLERLRDYGFACSVIDSSGRRRPAPEPQQVVSNCQAVAHGTGFVNLLLEK